MASNLQAISKWVISVVGKSAEELSPVFSSKWDAETVKTHEQQHWATVPQSVVTWCLPMSDDGSAPTTQVAKLLAMAQNGTISAADALVAAQQVAVQTTGSVPVTKRYKIDIAEPSTGPTQQIGVG
jgi:hypothetical protein